jgi:hypothetical protein
MPGLARLDRNEVRRRKIGSENVLANHTPTASSGELLSWRALRLDVKVNRYARMRQDRVDCG